MWCLCAQPTAHSSLLLLLRILGQSKNSSGFWDNAPSSEEEEDGMEERRARLFIIFFLSFFVSTFQCVSYSQGSCIGKNMCNHFCPTIAWLQSMSWFVQKAGWPLKMIGAEAHNYPRSKTRWLKGSLYFRLSLSFLFGGLLCIIHVADHLKVDVNDSRIGLCPVSQLKSPFIHK